MCSAMPISFASDSHPDYMNGYRCNVTGSTSTVPVAQSKVARRCGTDEPNNKLLSVPSNCTYGAKQPFYWFNKEQNNVRAVNHHSASPHVILKFPPDVRRHLLPALIPRPVQLPRRSAGRYFRGLVRHSSCSLSGRAYAGAKRNPLWRYLQDDYHAQTPHVSTVSSFPSASRRDDRN